MLPLQFILWTTRQRLSKESGEVSSEPQSRTRTPSPERQSRPAKKRKLRHKIPRGMVFPDGGFLYLMTMKLDTNPRSRHAEPRTRARSPRIVSNVRSYFPWFTLQLTRPRRFYAGCSTFLPVFDSRVDSFDALHQRSPFAVDAICMVGARVRDGGGEFILNVPSLFTIYSQEHQVKLTIEAWMQSRTYRVLLSFPL